MVINFLMKKACIYVYSTAALTLLVAIKNMSPLIKCYLLIPVSLLLFMMFMTTVVFPNSNFFNSRLRPYFVMTSYTYCTDSKSLTSVLIVVSQLSVHYHPTQLFVKSHKSRIVVVLITFFYIYMKHFHI